MRIMQLNFKNLTTKKKRGKKQRSQDSNADLVFHLSEPQFPHQQNRNIIYLQDLTEELQAKHSDQWLLLNKCWVFSLSSFMLEMSHLLAYPKQKANFKVYTLLFLALLLTGFRLGPHKDVHNPGMSQEQFWLTQQLGCLQQSSFCSETCIKSTSSPLFSLRQTDTYAGGKFF